MFVSSSLNNIISTQNPRSSRQFTSKILDNVAQNKKRGQEYTYQIVKRDQIKNLRSLLVKSCTTYNGKSYVIK